VNAYPLSQINIVKRWIIVWIKKQGGIKAIESARF
ncbi:unnamed protein product, partial [marine sediment metagenome]